MRQMTALLWKEWREQRLALLALGVIVGLSMVSYRLAGFGPHDPAPVFCCVVAAWVLGAAVAGGEHVSGTSVFLRTHPLRLSLVWAAKLVFGLVGVAATVGLSVVLSRLCCQWNPELRPVPATPLVWLSLCCFSLSHYYGCWLRSVISAMGLGLLSLPCLLLFVPLNPALSYISFRPPEWMVTTFVLSVSVVLLGLGAGRFAATVRVRSPLTRRERVGWFLRPVLLLGGVPLLVGFGILAVDLLRLDPTDADMVTMVSVAPDREHAVVFCPSVRYYPPWAQHRRRPLGFTLSLANGALEKFPELSPAIPYRSALWAPDSRRVAVVVRDESAKSKQKRDASRTVILDMEMGRLGSRAGDGHRFPLVWASPRQLVLLSASEGNRRSRLEIWDVCDKTWTDIALPASLRGADVLCMGHTADPVQAVMAVREGMRWQIFLLDPNTFHTRPVALPSGYRPSGPFRRGIRYMVLSPDQRQGTSIDEPPRLLDPLSGECVSVDRLLGGTPDGGWGKIWTLRVLMERWLLVMPEDPMTAPQRSWYAVDLVRQEAFHHEPPAPQPLGSRELCTSSDVLASMEWDTRRRERKIVFTPLRKPDITARVVLVIERGTIGGMARIDDRELALGFHADPSAKDQEGRLLRVFSHGGLAAIDPAAKRARPIWAGKGIDVRWHFMTWREWEDYRR